MEKFLIEENSTKPDSSLSLDTLLAKEKNDDSNLVIRRRRGGLGSSKPYPVSAYKTSTVKTDDLQNASEGSSSFHASTRNLHHLKRKQTTIKFSELDITTAHTFLMSKFNAYYGESTDRPMEVDYLISVLTILHDNDILLRKLNVDAKCDGHEAGLQIFSREEEEERARLTCEYHKNIKSEWISLDVPGIELPTITLSTVKSRTTHKNDYTTQSQLNDVSRPSQRDICHVCGCSDIVNEMVHQICSNCGVQLCASTTAFTVSYEQMHSTTVKSAVSYKKQNHFLDWLNTRQARETVDVSDCVVESVKRELEKDQITDFSNLEESRIRTYLKKLGKSCYYENIPRIIYKISGKAPLRFDYNVEEQLREMFLQIQEPFLKAKPAERTNFLSYGYVLHKFVELLDLDEEYKNMFPLLKSSEKLRAQDQIWEKICQQLGWYYYPSI